MVLALLEDIEGALARCLKRLPGNVHLNQTCMHELKSLGTSLAGEVAGNPMASRPKLMCKIQILFVYQLRD